MFELLKRISKVFTRVTNICNSSLLVLAVIAAGIMAIPTTIDVVGTLTIRHGIAGSIEIVEFLQVILVFGAVGAVLSRGEHIYVEMLIDKMPFGSKSTLRLIFYAFCGILFSIVAFQAYKVGIVKMKAQEVSFALHLPICIFIFFAALGSLTMAMAFFAKCLELTVELGKARCFIGIIIAIIVIAAAIHLPDMLKSMPWTKNKLVFGSIMMAAMLIMLLLGMPIGFAMLGAGFIGLLVIYPNYMPGLKLLGMGPYSTSATYIYSVVPMFILMGELAGASGISRELFMAASTWLGRLPGGLAIASIAGCAGFAAVSGDSMATAVTMASVALPEMEAKHYDGGFSCACLAAGGTLGILIPPSTGFIFYSLVTEVSIGKLFLAGVLPGLLLATVFMGLAMIFAMRNPELAPHGSSSTWCAKFRSIFGILPMLFLIALVLGGILGGFFSPNQGGAIGAVGTLLYALAFRRINWQGIKKSLVSSTLITARLNIILIGVGVLGNFFAATRLPNELANIITGLGSGRFIVFCALVIAYIILGCMMNVIPMILLTLPAIYPTIQAMGFDSVWFGVVVVILMEMGQITPPVGINVFALSTVASHIPMSETFKRIGPFFLSMLGMVFFLYAFPSVATWLPELLM